MPSHAYKNVSELFMSAAEKHNMSYQTPIFPFLSAPAVNSSVAINNVWNTAEIKPSGVCRSVSGPSSPAARKIHTHLCRYTHWQINRHAHRHTKSLSLTPCSQMQKCGCGILTEWNTGILSQRHIQTHTNSIHLLSLHSKAPPLLFFTRRTTSLPDMFNRGPFHGN